jgi:muconolactone delta-isomerase
VTRCRGSVEGAGRIKAVKFLVMWELDLARLSMGALHAVMRMPEYAQDVIDRGKLEARYHIVGKHGGAWIYDVDSNEELERVLALAPVYNFARYDIYPLAEMETPADILREQVS